MTRRHNVLYLARTWGVGGAQTIIALLLKHLDREKFNIIVVPYDAGNDAEEAFLDFLQKQDQLVVPDRIPWQSRTSWLRARQRICELIDKYDIDLIHTHDNLSHALVGIGRASFRSACVASAYGWFEPKPRVKVVAGDGWFDSAWSWKIRGYFWIDLNLSLPGFDRVYTVSYEMRRKLLRGRTQEDRIHVIHTGLDRTGFRSGACRDETRSRLGFAPEHVVVGTVSRLSGEKGHLVLLNAAKKALASFPGLRVLILGTGYMREAIERRAAELGIEDRVVLTGYYEDLPGALRAMDIFTLPSVLEEGFPTSVVEAQYAGVPVVASDIGGTHETMRHNETGLLVEPGSSEQLAEAVAALCLDPTRRQAMASEAKRWARDAFTLEQMMAEMEAMYLDAIASRSNS